MAKEDLNSYELSRDFFNWCFENPEKVTPTHVALYFFTIEHCNRLGWKLKFGLPSQMTMDAIGVKNWRTYSKAFNDLAEWGFLKVLEKSRNQYSATVIALVKNTKATTKALSKATQKHSQKHDSSIVGINKPDNLEPNNLLTEEEKKLSENLDEVYSYQTVKEAVMMRNEFTEDQWEKAWMVFRLHVMTEGKLQSVSELRGYTSNWIAKHKKEIFENNGITKTEQRQTEQAERDRQSELARHILNGTFNTEGQTG